MTNPCRFSREVSYLLKVAISEIALQRLASC